jgi:hypothetical protein
VPALPAGGVMPREDVEEVAQLAVGPLYKFANSADP